MLLAVALAACSTEGGVPNVASPVAIGSSLPQRHPDAGRSWMLPEAKSTKLLMYVGDWDTNDVFVYDYSTGKQVGQLTGFDEPYDMCVDAAGDVYIANFGSGNAVEYAHGGTALLNTYKSGGEPIGCSVLANGDVAVTSFKPGGVTVYSGGNPKKGKAYSDADCEYLWPMGYDEKGNLYGTGEYSQINICELPAGSKKMRTVNLVSAYGSFGSGAFMWDGRRLTVSGSYGDYDEAISEVEESPNGDLKLTGKLTVLTDNCYNDYVDVIGPFILGEKNTPVNHTRGYSIVGPNLWCADANTAKVDFWKYPKGGLPARALPNPPGAPYGAAVSISG